MKFPGLGAAAVIVTLAWPAMAENAAVDAPTQVPPAETVVAAADAAPDAGEIVPEAPGIHVLARVDLSDQRMFVYVEGRLVHTWAVSTGRGRMATPTGQWNAAWLSPRHRSKKYNNAPMPWSVFYYNGYAIHGTTDIKRLGRPASHGCVRLHPDNAKLFFQLVKDYGMESTLISVVR